MRVDRKAENNLKRQLREEEVPGALQSRERGQKMVLAEFRRRETSLSPGNRWRRLVVQIAVVLGVVALVVSPSGAAVRDWVSDAITRGQENASPALTKLPSPGRLLVESGAGVWVVNEDGSRRLLGDFDDATWSPKGLFVAATTGHQLVVIDPEGEVRWTISRNGLVSNPSWNAPDGFRVAYLEGDSLRVVAGDGSGDRLLTAGVAKVTPVWKPGAEYQLAFARPDGSVIVTAAESGRRIFEVVAPAQGPDQMPINLQWSANGRRLVVFRTSGIEQYDEKGNLIWNRQEPETSRITDGQIKPGGYAVAFTSSLRTGDSSRVTLEGPNEKTRDLFSGPGQFNDLEFSPDGRRLLVGWQSADQWLFLSPENPKKVVAVSNISRQFAPGSKPADRSFPLAEGWCCSE